MRTSGYVILRQSRRIPGATPKKVGYFIYIAGQLGPIILSFMTVDILTGGGFLGNIGMMAVVIGSLFPIAFIIMYGLNFKHLK